ncbi:MAG: hypothetical protein LBI60_06210 [Bacteroidales bacterium]|jgi:hypothetical protein|nr:hypothetical protein [Bacteroidales bacterium]
MTYKEWITATAKRFTIGTADVELILFNQRGLIPDENAEADITTAKTALCREFANLIPIADISEGGYSTSYNLDAIKLWYNQTCSELGLIPTGKPKIRNKSNIW